MASSMTPVLPAPVGAETTCGGEQEAHGRGCGDMLLQHVCRNWLCICMRLAGSPCQHEQHACHGKALC